MSEERILGNKVKELYKTLCQDEWNAYTVGVIVAFLSVLIMAWMRPWGAMGAMRNWGDWFLYGIGCFEDAPKNIFNNSGSVIGIGFIAGAFLSATLGGQFALRIPPFLEMVKAVLAGCLMGVGAALAGGCNVGAFYNAIGNLSAHGFAMWLGLVIGIIGGLKCLYWEMEHVTCGGSGAKTIEFPGALQVLLGMAVLVGLIAGAYAYAGSDDDYLVKMSGILLISAGLGYSMQRGRWCMLQGFREPHMTGDGTIAKAVALSVVLVAVGIAVIKCSGLRQIEYYVRGTFGWGGVVGGILFGFGGMLAGGCGTGALWRAGEGQIKLWIAIPFFAISNSLMSAWFKQNDYEGIRAWLNKGITNEGSLGSFLYLPETFLGYGGTLVLIIGAMVMWYLVVVWNEESNKLVLKI